MCPRVLVTRLCPTIESTRRSTHENSSARTQSRSIKLFIREMMSQSKYSSTYDCISCSWRGCIKIVGYQTACSVLCDLRINTPSILHLSSSLGSKRIEIAAQNNQTLRRCAERFFIPRNVRRAQDCSNNSTRSRVRGPEMQRDAKAESKMYMSDSRTSHRHVSAMRPCETPRKSKSSKCVFCFRRSDYEYFPQPASRLLSKHSVIITTQDSHRQPHGAEKKSAALQWHG